MIITAPCFDIDEDVFIEEFIVGNKDRVILNVKAKINFIKYKDLQYEDIQVI